MIFAGEEFSVDAEEWWWLDLGGDFIVILAVSLEDVLMGKDFVSAEMLALFLGLGVTLVLVLGKLSILILGSGEILLWL